MCGDKLLEMFRPGKGDEALQDSCPRRRRRAVKQWWRWCGCCAHAPQSRGQPRGCRVLLGGRRCAVGEPVQDSAEVAIGSA